VWHRGLTPPALGSRVRLVCEANPVGSQRVRGCWGRTRLSRCENAEQRSRSGAFPNAPQPAGRLSEQVRAGIWLPGLSSLPRLAKSEARWPLDRRDGYSQATGLPGRAEGILLYAGNLGIDNVRKCVAQASTMREKHAPSGAECTAKAGDVPTAATCPEGFRRKAGDAAYP